MNSSAVSGIHEWHTFNRECLKKAPIEPGVYIIRNLTGKQIHRLKGESDILYIGSARNRKGIRNRLRQHLRPGPTQTTSKRVNEYINRSNVEIGWLKTNEPENTEHQLLQRYSQEHDELPPLNHATKRLLRKELTEQLHMKESASGTPIRMEVDMFCRDEILDCARSIVDTKGRNEFSVRDILNLMKERRTRYKESTIRTHVTSKLCINSPKHHATKYNDFERIGRGLYKMRE